MIKKVTLQLLLSIVIIFVLIGAFTIVIVNINKVQDRTYEIKAVHEGLVQTIAYYLVKPILESTLDRYIEKNGLTEYLKEMQQQEEDPIQTHNITEGSGNKAFCGQEVFLQIYKLSQSNIAVPQSFQTTDVTLKIGDANPYKEVGMGVMEMKEGGERVVLVDNNPYYVKLVEVKDAYPESVNNLMIFDNLTSKIGKKVKCGDEVSVKYSVRKYNGEFQVKNQTVQFKVGDRKVPLAMEVGVVGMKVGNNRTIISPPETINDTYVNFDRENISIIDMTVE
ncbi:MAG: FKBP-type peptidyl-prolyl cis-trans isomerase [Wolbachia endosymbiont of Tyrophagus putrescentiae]|nr:FKBP-type peptidyl-prolyl cis-trans isomerase [Wolbachia endosymbiont of Tyrophagus putrescentiae]